MTTATSDVSGIEAFRAEARQWIAANCPASLIGTETAFYGGRKEPVSEEVLLWCSLCAERGWTAPDWPTELGGAGLAPLRHAALREEFAAAHAPEPLNGMGVTMIGPVILEYGTDEQKRRFLPPIAQGLVRWCQGFSEPNAGSDLASLRARAERKGDAYIVNGTKMWTTYGELGDWMFALVRTDPARPLREGISLILLEMDSPGIDAKAIELISGESNFCQCFFDDLSVPAGQLLGEENHGWAIAKRVLDHERISVSRPGSLINSGPGSGPGGDGRTLLDLIRPYIDASDDLTAASLEIEAAAADLDTRALALMQRRYDEAPEQAPAVFMSLLKYASTELTRRRMETYVKAAGFQGLGWEGGNWSSDEHEAIRYWLYSKSFTIAGGCSEVQLDIISKAELGMPT